MVFNCLLQFINEKKSNKNKNIINAENDLKDNNKKSTINRLQDNTLQELKDEGMCLSLHQPWASLLVNGIKK